MSILYSKIRELANQKHISLAELERTLSFSNGIISTWKNGKPSIDKVEKVADYFGVSTDYLLGRTDNPSIPNQKNAPTTFESLGLPYKGIIPEDVNDMYRAIAKQYAEKHNLPKRDV